LHRQQAAVVALIHDFCMLTATIAGAQTIYATLWAWHFSYIESWEWEWQYALSHEGDACHSARTK